MPHTHNSQSQHISEEKTPYSTTKQQARQTTQKSNPADNQKELTQKTPTTTQKVSNEAATSNLKQQKK